MPKGKPEPYAQGGKPFTLLEIGVLLDRAFSGEWGMDRLRRSMGRSEDSVQTKLWKLMVNHQNEGYDPATPRANRNRTGCRWNELERDHLRFAWTEWRGEGGPSFEYIAQVLCRSVDEVRLKVAEQMVQEVAPPRRRTLGLEDDTNKLPP